MVVDHNHICIHRGFTRFDHKTVFIQRAVAAGQLSLVLVTSGRAGESSATLAQVLISPSSVWLAGREG